MNKSELIERIASSADISKASAGRALDAGLAAIMEALRQGEAVSLPGFGGFAVATRAARNGRNPRTGEVIHIQSAKIVKFKPGKELKEAVN